MVNTMIVCFIQGRYEDLLIKDPDKNQDLLHDLGLCVPLSEVANGEVFFILFAFCTPQVSSQH